MLCSSTFFMLVPWFSCVLFCNSEHRFSLLPVIADTGPQKEEYMSRQLPQKPNLEYLKKQAKELLRSMPQGKLADAQHTLANDYGFANWAELKSHVQSLGLSPAEALKAAVCDSDAARVREVLERYPELRAKIDEPLPELRLRPTRVVRGGTAERSGDNRCAAARGCRHPEANRVVGGRIRRAGRLRSEHGRVSDRARRGGGCALRCAAGNDAEAERAGGGGSGRGAHKRWRRTDAAALRLHRGGCGVPSGERRRDRCARCGSRIDAGAVYAARRAEAALSEGPAGCRSLLGIARMPDGHFDGGGARRHGSGTPAPGQRSRLHPDERIGGMVSKAEIRARAARFTSGSWGRTAPHTR